MNDFTITQAKLRYPILQILKKYKKMTHGLASKLFINIMHYIFFKNDFSFSDAENKFLIFMLNTSFF